MTLKPGLAFTASDTIR